MFEEITRENQIQAVLGQVPGLGAILFDEVNAGAKTLSGAGVHVHRDFAADRKSTRLNSSHLGISYAVPCLKKTPLRTDVSAQPADKSPHQSMPTTLAPS